MKRKFVVAVVAIVVLALTGCSSMSTPKVTVDGKDQSINCCARESQLVTCTPDQDRTLDRLEIDVGDQSKGFEGAVILRNKVTDVGVVFNGSKLVSQTQGGDATMSKDENKYTFTGHLAVMSDLLNPAAPQPSHAFSMVVTC